MRKLIKLIQIFISVFSILLIIGMDSCHAEPNGKILLSVVDAGGNAGPYGIFYLNGPVSRTQSFACARTSGGLYPSGITDCYTYYGSNVSSEWQPGDVLTARVNKLGSTSIPIEVKPSDAYLCGWEFKGWSGACEGLGTVNNANEYECTFTLPSSGNVSLSAAFSGSDNQGRPCPALTNPNPTTPVPTATPKGTDPNTDGDRLLSKLNEIADDIIDNLKLRGFLKDIATKLIIPKDSEFKYDIKVTVTATGEGVSSAALPARKEKNKPIKITPITGNPVMASGHGKMSTTKKTVIKLATTSKGKKIPKGRTSLEVLINVKALLKGEVIQSVSITTVIY